MRILVLTPINPIIAGEAYTKILEKFEKPYERKGILCFPVFAEIRSQMNNQSYIPTFFAMIEVSLDKDMQRKLYDRKNMIVVGNTYKKQKFDLVVALDESGPDDLFDPYIEQIKKDKELEDFREKVKVDNLYGLKDAKIVLPTINHLLLFLEGAFEKDEEKNKPKQ